ncbi:MAG: hypothetical protein ISS78_05800 [Phycisphaerae bacterium]|nr:hypothetical protein [Phycisphaerae bacterium]
MANRVADSAAAGTGSSAGPRRHSDLLAAWGLSGVLHLVILLAAVMLTWPVEDGSSGRQAERRVGIVHADDTPAIQAGTGGPVGSARQAGELAVPSLRPTSAIDPVGGLGEASRPGAIERVIGVDLSAGALSPDASGGDWASLASGAGGQGGGGASFFGLEARGTKFVYVVDRSGSMKGPILAAAKAELLRSVASLDRDASFYTIFFDDRVEAMPGLALVRATEASKKSHFDWVSRIKPGGATHPAEAMQLALSLRPDAVWLLSDGLFDQSAIGVIRKANVGRRARIHTIAFYNRKGEAQLKQIAEENRGAYRYVSPAALGLGGR